MNTGQGIESTYGIRNGESVSIYRKKNTAFIPLLRTKTIALTFKYKIFNINFNDGLLCTNSFFFTVELKLLGILREWEHSINSTNT